MSRIFKTTIGLLATGLVMATTAASQQPAPVAKPLGADLVIGRVGNFQKGWIGMLFGDGSGGFTLNTSAFDEAGQTHEVTVGDLNEDGKDDVVVVASGGRVYVALGDFSDGLQKSDFTSVGAFIEGSGNCCNRTRVVQLGDLNNDGNVDIAVTMWTAVGVMLGNGNGTFGSPILTNAGGDARGMALGDVDGDGNLDVVANHATGNWSIAVYRGKGNGAFLPGASISTSALAIPNVFIADADGDGDLDIYSGALGARLKIFTNDGFANFTLTNVEPSSAHSGRPLVVDDLNGDEAPDVVAVTEANGSTNIRVWLSNGSGGLAPADLGSVSSQPTHGAVADIDGDGIKDIAMVTPHPTNTSNVWILPGTGHGTFGALYSVGTYAGGYTIAAGNFDSPADTTPPVITPSISGTLGGDGWYTDDVTVSWSVSDPESSFTTSGCDTQTVTTDTSGTTFTCEATSLGGTSSDSVTIKRDTAGPVIASATANPSMLWPPNNKMVAVTVSVDASDAGSGLAGCSITWVSSNEGGSAHEPDVALTGDLTMNLRAERHGSGSGRIYAAQISCTDAAGNASTGSATVTVPHDQRKR